MSVSDCSQDCVEVGRQPSSRKKRELGWILDRVESGLLEAEIDLVDVIVVARQPEIVAGKDETDCARSGRTPARDWVWASAQDSDKGCEAAGVRRSGVARSWI